MFLPIDNVEFLLHKYIILVSFSFLKRLTAAFQNNFSGLLFMCSTVIVITKIVVTKMNDKSYMQGLLFQNQCNIYAFFHSMNRSIRSRVNM